MFKTRFFLPLPQVTGGIHSTIKRSLVTKASAICYASRKVVKLIRWVLVGLAIVLGMVSPL